MDTLPALPWLQEAVPFAEKWLERRPAPLKRGHLLARK